MALLGFAASLLAFVPALWWAGVILAFLLLFAVGCSLIVIEQRIQKNTGAAVVERLDGKDGDIVLLTDDPDNPIPPPAPPPASQVEKPWKK